jgi:hypothetical protein
MTDQSPDNVVRIHAHRAPRQQDDRHDELAPSEATRYADSLSLAVFGFWPGLMWLPLPFDTRDAARRRR